jgi:amino-acid N-acetyltransferase
MKSSTMQTGTVRRARMRDARAIHDIIEPHAKANAMLARPMSEIYEALRDFLVFDDGKRVLGVVALHFSWENLAELRSLAVVEKLHGQGIGGRLIEACLDEARAFDIQQVFTLTYKPGLFQRYGFREAKKEIFPQKIWKDCMRCPLQHDCKEIAMLVEV